MSKSKFLAGMILGFVAPWLFPNPNAIAQIAKPTTESQQALQELRQDNRGDIFNANNGTTGLMQLIHNANMFNSKTSDQLRAEQSESLDQSVKQFRDRQRQLTITEPSAPKTK
jgi:preprotein translocase subunit SecD